MSSTPTARAVSPDSGQHWTAEGAWPVAEGIHRIPLPLPSDGLRAVNVYALQTDDGLMLIDGGWAIPEARELLDRCLRSIGSGFGDLRGFWVTHVHRDHFTLATVLAHELGIDVAMGIGEQPALDLINRRLVPDAEPEPHPFEAVLVSAGALDVAAAWAEGAPQPQEPELWRPPTDWLDGDHVVHAGRRALDAVHTPGHTPGHYVFADRGAGLLFAGDHVLPTITPSIGFTAPPTPDPLGDFMASLTKVRGLPDLTVLPAHGPVGSSSHARVDELLVHHEERLDQCLTALATRTGPSSPDGDSGADGATAAWVAAQLGWTRHQTPYADLDVFNRGLAAMETKAHLEVLVARGQLTRADAPDGVRFTPAR